MIITIIIYYIYIIYNQCYYSMYSWATASKCDYITILILKNIGHRSSMCSVPIIWYVYISNRIHWLKSAFILCILYTYDIIYILLWYAYTNIRDIGTIYIMYKWQLQYLIIFIQTDTKYVCLIIYIYISINVHCTMYILIVIYIPNIYLYTYNYTYLYLKTI